MEIQEEIKNKINRTIRALSSKPSLGYTTSVSTARITNGLACEVKEGDWVLKADMPDRAGGTETAPTPGILGRAALGSCLSIGYMMQAALLDIPIKSLEVEIEADWDAGGAFGTSEVFSGYLELRYRVRVESNASEEDILKVLDAGDKFSPYLDVFTRSQTCLRKVEIIQSKDVEK
jgi:uncharacterized OsmC-like protein